MGSPVCGLVDGFFQMTVYCDYIQPEFNRMPSFLRYSCRRTRYSSSRTLKSRLTEPLKHNILCRVAVSGTSARPKRESGANPELPRSGNWERPCLGTEPLTTRPGFGKRHVRNGPIHSAAPGSPKTCRDLHLTRGAVRLWSSRGRSDRSDRVHVVPPIAPVHAPASVLCCSGEQRPANRGSDGSLFRCSPTGVDCFDGTSP
jgi:hypothetical protein